MAGNCSAPYCVGSDSGFCGCSCNKCCPPCPCLTSITWVWKTGTSEEDWEGAEPNNGCDCDVTPTPTTFRSKNIEFPDFPVFEEQEYGLTKQTEMFVFALADEFYYCDLECQDHEVTLTTDGCCLYNYLDSPGAGTGNAFEYCTVAIGGGVASVIGGTDLGCYDEEDPNQRFRTYFKSIDTGSVWEERSSSPVQDCECFCIKIVPPSASCCVSCFKESSYTSLNSTTDPLNCPGLYGICSPTVSLRKRSAAIRNMIDTEKLKLKKSIVMKKIIKGLQNK